MSIENFSMSDEDVAVWLGLYSMSGPAYGAKLTKRLIERFGGMKDAWNATRDELISIGGFNREFVEDFISKRNAVNIESQLTALKRSGVLAIPYTHQLYPHRLREIHDPPSVLFVNGNLYESDFLHAIAVVGTRDPSSYGQKLAKDVARGLSQSGASVVSGMAIGVDSLAHWGAIEGGGRTIAVVATGPDLCYPTSNKRLMTAIMDGHGIIVSEYFPGTTAEKWHFPARNRIVSGIVSGIVVVEAAESSGALITARLGFEQNRDVFAFPGRVDSRMSAGTNKLIADLQARLITGHKDVLDGLEWVPTKVREMTTVVELFGREKEIYEMLSNEPTHFDVLCHQSGMNAGEMSSTLTMLELAGVIARHPGDWYARA